MATRTKKALSEDKLIELYIDQLLTTSEEPKSVYAFAKENNFDETLFYKHFNSFESLEKGIFRNMGAATIALLEKNEEFQSYDSRNKLLSFYFTFFEMMLANRSYVFLRLKQNVNKLESLRLLGGLKEAFIPFIQSLELKQVDFKNDQLNDFRNKSIEQTAWIQLLMTIKFWLEDDSKGFEKTDLYIEKSIKASFDLMDTTPVKSIIDFAKFIWKEKVNV